MNEHVLSGLKLFAEPRQLVVRRDRGGSNHLHWHEHRRIICHIGQSTMIKPAPIKKRSRRSRRSSTIRTQIRTHTEGMNMRELCRRAGVPYSSTVRWINGEVGRRLAIEHLEKIVVALELDVKIEKR